MVLLLLVAAALLAAVYYFFNAIYEKYDYFTKRGIPQLPTKFLYGNSKDLILQNKFVGEMYQEFYSKFKQMGVAHGGVYNVRGKTWVPVDTQLIKNILTKDFAHFNAHNHRIPGLYFNNIFHMSGDEWKDMRRKLTPTFTSGKMKMMFDIILEKCNNLIDLIDQQSKTGESLEIKEALVRFTTDIVASCGFGIECNSLKDKNFDFYRQIQDGFKESVRNAPKPTVFQLFSQYVVKTRGTLPSFGPVEDFFREAIRETLRYREENKVVRKDFLHLMIQLKNKGVVTELTNDTADVFNKTVSEDAMTLEDIAGQCLIFYSAGFGTSSTTMSFSLLELARHTDIQTKLREEVREVMKRHNGKLTYDALQEMTYCENVIYETLRKYPSLPVLFRLCTKDYTIPGTDSVIEKDTTVYVPVLGLHRDPEYFPDPEKFIPERFSAENKSKIKDFSFLPFGEGPRMCLGLRFGVMQSKAGLATMINNFEITLNKKTPYPPTLKTYTFVPEVEGGIWLNAKKIN